MTRRPSAQSMASRLATAASPGHRTGHRMLAGSLQVLGSKQKSSPTHSPLSHRNAERSSRPSPAPATPTWMLAFLSTSLNSLIRVTVGARIADETEDRTRRSTATAARYQLRQRTVPGRSWLPSSSEHEGAPSRRCWSCSEAGQWPRLPDPPRAGGRANPVRECCQLGGHRERDRCRGARPELSTVEQAPAFGSC